MTLANSYETNSKWKENKAEMSPIVQIFILASIPILAFLLTLIIFFIARFYVPNHEIDKKRDKRKKK